MEQIQYLRRRLMMAMLVLLISALAMIGATFAWYLYNTSIHTTSVRMAAGTGTSLQICNTYQGDYGSTAALDTSFIGRLEPVSTDRILGGFQKVTEFIDGEEGEAERLAASFTESADYYKTTLYLRTNAKSIPVYVSSIDYSDSDEQRPISTAIRVGFVVHSPGEDQPPVSEHIFSINEAENPDREYNTATGEAGYVLDSAYQDGTTVPFTPWTSENYCIYNSETGATTLKPASHELCTLTGSASDFGEPTQIDIYIWLEGCDEDCTGNLNNTTLSSLSVSFSGYIE